MEEYSSTKRKVLGSNPSVDYCRGSLMVECWSLFPFIFLKNVDYSYSCQAAQWITRYPTKLVSVSSNLLDDFRKKNRYLKFLKNMSSSKPG